MPPGFPILIVACAAPVVDVPTQLWQVAPAKPGGKSRAVVLIPGLYIYPLRPTRATHPERRDWQEPNSELVKLLAKDADVFAFSYAQTARVDDVAQSAGLRDAVVQLRKSGYKELVLLGHSAGGVIARQFVERNPDAGVTKVIAVAAPFAGSELASFKLGYPKVQAPLVQSLAPQARMEASRINTHALGKDVEFACVVCKLKLVDTDGLVFTRSQWPEDLQRLGVPTVLASVSHFCAMQDADTTKTIAELAREKLTRWSPEEVEKARKILFGEPTRPDRMK